MSGAIAVLVKTPGYSPVKTRLAKHSSSAFASSWYAIAADAVASVACEAAQMTGAIVYWAVAEDEALDAACWDGLPVIAQGPADLGTRMHRVHTALVERHGSAILLGADAPQLDAGVLRQSLLWLREDRARLCIGPAHDGGFWLFGANRPIALERWLGVPYSAADTATRFCAALHGFGDWLSVAALTDVDTTGDLVPCMEEIRCLPTIEPAQQRLLDWMNVNVPPHNVAPA